MKYDRIVPLFLFVTISFVPLFADDAWNAVKIYRYGDDVKPLLAVEAEVQRATAAPETKRQTAARLAALLDENTTYPGRQFVCLQLRLVGGAAEVPKLAEWLGRTEDTENVRMALEDIPCDESLVPLRKVLETFKGRALVGVIASLAARNDRESIPAFVRLLGDEDRDVAAAAASALGRFGTEGVEALRKVEGRISKVAVGAALVRIADSLAGSGKKDDASKVYEFLSDSEMPKGLRRAALEGHLRLLDEDVRKQTVLAWLFEKDPEKGLIAVSHLSELSSEQHTELFKKSETMNSSAKSALLEIMTERNGAEMLDILLKNLKSDDPAERLTAFRAVAGLCDPSTIPLFFDALAGEPALRNIAKDALIRFPQNDVSPLLLKALQDQERRNSAIDIAVAMKYYDAINPLLKLAQSEDESVSGPAIEGLAKLCDPDEHDLPRMIGLYLASRPGKHREKVERALIVVCEKIPDASLRADTLIALLEKRDGGLSGQLLIDALPLLGKVGNGRVADIVKPLLDDKDPALRQAAVRAFCNWPDATHLDGLWNMATKNPSKQYRQWALRAFIRVATLKSDRPESETLVLLRKAMDVAVDDADRQWCLSRAGAIRTMDSAEWAATYLDDAALSQTACTVLVDLAHHRFLREPNKARFEPLLLKVEQTAKDKGIAERAKKSRLGM